MKTISSLCSAVVGCLACIIFLTGCPKAKPPEKSTLEKLKSSDPSEQEQGLHEAEEKFGVKKS